jgi:hypothetical protein
MNFDWILSPLTVYAVLGLNLVASISLFLHTKVEIAQLRRDTDRSRTELAKKMEEIESAMAGISATPPPPAPALRPSINLTKRAQALRMRRRGESLESIAAALAVPRNEVELLLKVHEMLEARSN